MLFVSYKLVLFLAITDTGCFFELSQFQYQKENRQSANHSLRFTGTAPVIGNYLFGTEIGGAVKRNTLYYLCKDMSVSRNYCFLKEID